MIRIWASNHMTPSCGKAESRLLIVIGLIASAITIFVFVTGVPSLRRLFPPEIVVKEPSPPAEPTQVKSPGTTSTPARPRPATEPSSVKPPETTSTAALPRRGIFPVGREFSEGTGIGVGKVHLFNIEIVEGGLLKFNFLFNWETGLNNPVDVNLDNPADTTFLVDTLGRQHPLVQATEISAEKPIRVSPGSSKRFTLTFQFPPEMRSFKYQATLLMTTTAGLARNVQSRLRIRTEKEINLTDFQ